MNEGNNSFALLPCLKVIDACVKTRELIELERDKRKIESMEDRVKLENLIRKITFRKPIKIPLTFNDFCKKYGENYYDPFINCIDYTKFETCEKLRMLVLAIPDYKNEFINVTAEDFDCISDDYIFEKS